MRCLLALVLAAAACGGSDPRVSLAGTWPTHVDDDYDDPYAAYIDDDEDADASRR